MNYGSYETLIVERQGHIGWLIFNRPEQLNAMNNQMRDELAGEIACAIHRAGETRARARHEHGTGVREDRRRHDQRQGGRRHTFVAELWQYQNTTDHPRIVVRRDAELRRELKELHQNLSATMIYVTHDQVEAMTMADRIVVMNHGVIEQVGTPLEIYREPASPFVADFVGKVNVLPARVAAGELRFGIAAFDHILEIERSQHPA